MYYGKEVRDDLLSHVDIVDVIRRHVSLKQSGDNYKGICPFHPDKNPSMSVSRKLQMYKCFACGNSGNAITFTMNYDHLSYNEAVEALADSVGYKLPAGEYSPEEKKKKALAEKIMAINKESAMFYYRMLHSSAGKYGMKYFTDRGLSLETIKHFGLGYSPMEFDSLYRYLKSKGYDDEILKESGLFVYSEKGVRDKFINRVMFPIMDQASKVVGFGGRIMGEGEPKYLNSPETLVFHKSGILYGMNIAKKTRAPYMIICEGYMDVIALHQAGFDMAVAALGTAFTEKHAKILKKVNDTVYLTFDSDGPGVKAALRAIPILSSQDLFVKSIDLKPYKDPDEFIKALGQEEFKKRIEGSLNSVMYRIKQLEPKYDFSDPAARTQFQNEVAKIISELETEQDRSNYIDVCCDEYKIKLDILTDRVNYYGTEALKKEAQKQEILTPLKQEDVKTKNERVLLSLLIQRPEIYEKIKDVVMPEYFCDDIYKRVSQYIFEKRSLNEEIIPSMLSNNFDNEEDIMKVESLFGADINLGESIEEQSIGLTGLVKKVVENGLRNNPELSKDVKKAIERKKQLENLRINL